MPSFLSSVIICPLVVSYHLILGLPTLLKSALTLSPCSVIEIFFMESSSSALMMCAYNLSFDKSRREYFQLFIIETDNINSNNNDNHDNTDYNNITNNDNNHMH